LLYRILLFSVKPQHESAIGMHISPPNLPPISLPIPPLQADREPLFEFPEPYSKYLLAIYFTYGNVSFYVTPLPLSPCPYVCFSFQFRSVTQSCQTLWNPMNPSTPGLLVHHQLPEFTQTHVHRVSDAIYASHSLSSPSPPGPNPS